MATNPYVNKVALANGTTLIDLTSDTVTAAKLAYGYTAHDASGAVITGSMAEPVAMTTAEIEAAADAGWNGSTS